MNYNKITTASSTKITMKTENYVFCLLFKNTIFLC